MRAVPELNYCNRFGLPPSPLLVDIIPGLRRRRRETFCMSRLCRKLNCNGRAEVEPFCPNGIYYAHAKYAAVASIRTACRDLRVRWGDIIIVKTAAVSTLRLSRWLRRRRPHSPWTWTQSGYLHRRLRRCRWKCSSKISMPPPERNEVMHAGDSRADKMCD